MFGRKCGVRKALLTAIGAYIVIAILGFFMTKEIHFYLLAVCIGLFQGGIQALSRSYFSRLIPEGHSSQFYGFFNMLGKFAAIVGPVLVGIMSVITGVLVGIMSVITGEQRYGILSLIILFVLGFVLLRKVDDRKAREEAEAFASKHR